MKINTQNVRLPKNVIASGLEKTQPIDNRPTTVTEISFQSWVLFYGNLFQSWFFVLFGYSDYLLHLANRLGFLV